MLESFLPEKGAFAEGRSDFLFSVRKKWRHKFHNSQRDVMRNNFVRKEGVKDSLVAVF